MTRVYIGDCESTGVTNHPVLGYPQVIEWGQLEVDNHIPTLLKSIYKIQNENSFIKSISIIESKGTSKRYKPSMTIHKRAREVHGIWNKDLFKEDRSEDLELPEMDYLIGHNIVYDLRCLGKPEGIKPICTMGLAKQLDKQLGIGFKNSKQDDLLLHFYGEQIRDLVTGHHAALTDCVKCLLLLIKLLEYIPGVTTLEELYELQQAYKGKKK